MLKQNVKMIFLLCLIPMSSFAGTINITDPAAVTASGHYLNGPTAYHQKNVSDGVLPTGYADTSSWNAGSGVGWLQLDLGDVYTVDGVELYLTSGNNFNILVGDGTNWSQLNGALQSTVPYAAPGSPAHAYSWYTVSADNIVSGQFLRYEVVGGGHWAHLGEIEVSGTLSAVPVPAAAWLFGSALIGLVGVARRKKV